MIEVRKLLETATFDPSFDRETVQWNEELGFMQVDPATLSIEAVRLVGFALPLIKPGGTDRVVSPITTYRGLPRVERKNIDKLLKGIGPRLHDTLEAFAGNSGHPGNVGIYTIDVDPDPKHLLQLHPGNRVARLARHAGLLVRATIGDPEEVINEIHESYGKADAVRMTLPPRSEGRQLLRRVKNPAEIPPQFILVRNPNITLHKVGSAPALR
jgi:hypothetical protein